MKYHTLFFQKLGKMLENLSSSAVVICALSVNVFSTTIRPKNGSRLSICIGWMCVRCGGTWGMDMRNFSANARFRTNAVLKNLPLVASKNSNEHTLKPV